MGIVVKNIVKIFPAGISKNQDFCAVDHVSFNVPEGHLVALLGPSGSGKSTILRVIAGLELPDSGDVYLQGQNVSWRPAKERQVGFVFQHYALFKHMTVWKNIAFGLEVNKWPKQSIKERVDEFLDLVQLKGYENRYPSQLSGGQRQRVALARALAPKPKFLLLDEPFGALDAKVRRNLSSQLKRLHEEVQTTSVFVTHDQEEAFELADEIVVINRGRVEQIGTAEEIYDSPCSKFVASFIGNVNVVEGIIENDIIRIGITNTPIPDVLSQRKTGDIVLLIRPENIIREKEFTPHSISATIISASYRGDRYEVHLNVDGLELRMVVDKTRGQSRSWEIGTTIPIRFTQYSVFEADEGHAALRMKLQSLGYIE